MGAIVKSRAFKSGNSVAVRLPKSFGVDAGTNLMLEQRDGGISIRREFDVDDHRRKLTAMFDTIARIWEEAGGPPETGMKRDLDIFPDRPGLYGPEQE
ncbi:AbrB/MazE/SpoVT family DNA-binding domain-containing protein [Sphingomonas bacterium]|uniref:AbrB/MazE/SpoVT family DNA-binding domain-containing protein n=1 Tax=Sphingomonas bacterium TaxID=1895847 RepID=UPI001575AA8A|nr:AbrB/MazE/SpoVT family DNA-binding domain-containing protein [Sphingomonas bacterium]